MSPHFRRRRPTSISSSLLILSISLLGGALIQACTFDWDSYDPRLGAGQTNSSSSSGIGGMGEASSTSSSGSMGGGGQAMSSSSSGDGGMAGAGGAGGMVATGGMGGAGGMAGMGGGGGMGGGPCGGMYLLTEDFSQPIDTNWKWDVYAGPGTSSSLDNGQWLLRLPANSTTSHYAMLMSRLTYDLRGSEMFVDVSTVPNALTTAQSSLIALIDDANNLRFQYEQGKIYIAQKKNNVDMTRAQFTFDPILHRFWRMREQAGSFYWETSPDGMAWTIRSQTPTSTLAPVDYVYFLIDVYVSGAQMNPGEARYDNLNGGLPAMGNYCPVGTVQDNFDDGVTGHQWEQTNDANGCTYTEMGGEFIVTPPLTVSDYCGYSTSSAYDLRSNAVRVEVKQTTNTMADTGTYLTVDAKGGKIEMAQEGDMLFMRYETPMTSADVGAELYDPMQHRWWRIREKTGMIYWETSADGMTWNIRAQTMTPMPVDAVQVSLAAGTGSVVAMPGEAHFDNFNIGP